MFLLKYKGGDSRAPMMLNQKLQVKLTFEIHFENYFRKNRSILGLEKQSGDRRKISPATSVSFESCIC